MWADSQGHLYTCEAGRCSLPGRATLVLKHDKWHHVSIVVDCVSGDLEVFLDGTCLHIKGEGVNLSCTLQLRGADMFSPTVL